MLIDLKNWIIYQWTYLKKKCYQDGNECSYILFPIQVSEDDSDWVADLMLYRKSFRFFRRTTCIHRLTSF